MNSTQQATDDYDDDHDENDNDDAFLPEYLQFPIHYKLTEGQHVILIVATCISTLLSIAGSSCIIYLVVCKTKSIDRTSRQRLLVGLSTFDILSSVRHVLARFWTNDVKEIIPPNIACTLTGYFGFIGQSVVLYNMSLCLYYWVTIRGRCAIEQFSKSYEPYCHIVSSMYTIIIASVGLLDEGGILLWGFQLVKQLQFNWMDALA